MHSIVAGTCVTLPTVDAPKDLPQESPLLIHIVVADYCEEDGKPGQSAWAYTNKAASHTRVEMCIAAAQMNPRARVSIIEYRLPLNAAIEKEILDG